MCSSPNTRWNSIADSRREVQLASSTQQPTPDQGTSARTHFRRMALGCTFPASSIPRFSWYGEDDIKHAVSITTSSTKKSSEISLSTTQRLTDNSVIASHESISNQVIGPTAHSFASRFRPNERQNEVNALRTANVQYMNTHISCQ